LKKNKELCIKLKYMNHDHGIQSTRAEKTHKSKNPNAHNKKGERVFFGGKRKTENNIQKGKGQVRKKERHII